MRFTIDVIGPNEDSMYRTEIDAISPKWAKVAAQRLFASYAKRGATCARVLNPYGEEIFRFS